MNIVLYTTDISEVKQIDSVVQVFYILSDFPSTCFISCENGIDILGYCGFVYFYLLFCFCFMYFETLLLGAYRFRIMSS